MRKLGNHGDKNKPDSHQDSLEGGGIVLQPSHSHAHDMWETSHRKNQHGRGTNPRTGKVDGTSQMQPAAAWAGLPSPITSQGG